MKSAKNSGPWRLQPGAVIMFAERHAEALDLLAEEEGDPERRKELKQMAEICRRVPAKAPTDHA